MLKPLGITSVPLLHLSGFSSNRVETRYDKNILWWPFANTKTYTSIGRIGNLLKERALLSVDGAKQNFCILTSSAAIKRCVRRLAQNKACLHSDTNLGHTVLLEHKPNMLPISLSQEQVEQIPMFRVLRPVSPLGIASDGWLPVWNKSVSAGFEPTPQGVPKISRQTQMEQT